MPRSEKNYSNQLVTDISGTPWVTVRDRKILPKTVARPVEPAIPATFSTGEQAKPAPRSDAKPAPRSDGRAG